MKGKKNYETNPNAFDTLVGKNAVFTGKLESSGLTRVEGQINGDVILDGNLIVGQDSSVRGNIKAINVDVFGSVYGNIEVRSILTLHDTAKLVGDINVKSLIVKENATFEGRCSMKIGQTTEEKKHDKL